MAAVVIGGGFFGCSLALALRERGERVTLVEREADLLLRASANNQARVHGGYHYPRSILTALRSRLNYPRFIAEFAPCIDRSFRHYYAVARRQSHVTARQFETFCHRIGARLAPAPAEVRAWFDAELVEKVYEVEEHAFDVELLRAAVRERLQDARVEVQLATRALRAAAPRARRGGAGRAAAGPAGLRGHRDVRPLLLVDAFSGAAPPLAHPRALHAALRLGGAGRARGTAAPAVRVALPAHAQGRAAVSSRPVDGAPRPLPVRGEDRAATIRA